MRLLLLAALLALAGTAHAQRPIDAAAVEAALNVADAEALAALYTEDAVVRMSGEPPLKTRTGLQTYYEEAGLPRMTDFEVDEVIQLGREYAYASGAYTLRRADGGERVVFAALLRRVGDQWLIHRVLAHPDAS